MADPRGTEGPFFYRGVFHYPSVKSDELTPELRMEMIRTYRMLLKSYGNSWQGRRNARKIFRTILYPKVGRRIVR